MPPLAWAVLAVFGVAVAAGVVLADGPGELPARGADAVDVELPGPAAVEPPPPAALPDDPGAGASRPASEPDHGSPPQAAADPTRCTPDGCELWRLDGLDLRELDVHEQLLVYVEHGQVTAIDPDTGATAHDTTLAATGGLRLPQTASATYADQQLVLVAMGKRLWALDAADGGVLWQVELDDLRITGIGRRAGRIIVGGVVGGAREQRPPNGVAAFEPSGALQWQMRVDELLTVPWDGEHDDLLARADGQLRRIRLDDAATTWRRPMDQRHLHRHVDDAVLIADLQHGTVKVLDRGSGRLVHELTFDGVEWVQPLGPWVMVAAGEQVHVVDPAEGRSLFTRDRGRGTPPTASAAVVADGADQHIAVAWPYTDADGRGEVDLDLFRPDGSLERSLEVPVPATAATGHAWPTHVEAVEDAVEDARLRVVAGYGRDIVQVDAAEHRILEADHRDGLDWLNGQDVTWFDDVAVVRGEHGIEFHGTGGALGVRGGSPQLVSQRPLLVGDADALVRLDETLLRP